MKPFVIAASVLVAGALIAGFALVGSPKTERARRLDEARIRNLQMVQDTIANHLAEGKGLPETLSALEEEYPYLALKDPETGAPYAYEKRGEDSFALCAVFTGSNEKDRLDRTFINPPAPGARAIKEYNWTHPVGSYCFTRTLTTPLNS